MLARYLEAEGFAVETAADGMAALAAIRDTAPDVVVLDVAMPEMDGFEVLRRLRATSDVFVIMLTARTEEMDRVVGLGMGADDYVTKPFSPRELVARIHAVLRRGRGDHADSGKDVLTFSGLTIDRGTREVRVDGELVELTALEFDILHALASARGRVFTRTQLLETVWGFDYYGSDRVVDVHIANIRRALPDDASEPRFVATVRGVGYRFVAAPA